MPDHMNITHPDRHGVSSDLYRNILEIAKLKVELEQLGRWHAAVCGDLEAIFERIGRGEFAELHYPDGRVFRVEGKEQD